MAMSLAAFALAGCNKEEMESAYLEVVRSDVDFSAAGGTGEMQISTNAASVSAVSDRTWLEVTSSSTESVRFSVASSQEEFSRVANVTITAGGVSQEVTVSQMGLIFFLDQGSTSGVLELDPDGEPTVLTYSANTSDGIDIQVSDTWLSVTLDGNGNMTFTPEVNFTQAERTATVSVSMGWKDMELTVSQAEAHILGTSELMLSRDADDDFTVDTPQWAGSTAWTASTDADWISVTASDDGDAVFTFSENTTGTNRQCTIDFMYEGATETVTVTQRMWSYNFFLGEWTVNSNTEMGPVPALLEEDIPGSTYTLWVYDSSFGSFPLTVTYDDDTATLSLKTQYVSALEGIVTGYYFWWCALYGGYVTWSTDAGMNFVYNMDEGNQALTGSDDGDYSNTDPITGFSLYVFDSQTASSGGLLGYWSRFSNMQSLTR